MKIGILIAGDTEGELQTRYGTFASMFVRMFQQSRHAFSYAFYDVRVGEWPESPEACDSWLITGSVDGVYDNLPWMVPLQQLIVEISQSGRPLIGICFGHQIIAAALGGVVEKSDKGWGLGLHTYNVNADSVGEHPLPDTLRINAMHQDQVIQPPEGAEVFLSSEFCPCAGFFYGKNVVTFQAHPEFTHVYSKAQIEDCLGTAFPEAIAQSAVNDYNSVLPPADSELISRWLAGIMLANKRERLNAESNTTA